MTDSQPDSTRRREHDLPVTHVTDEDPSCLPLMPADIVEHLSTEERSAFFCTLVDAVIDAIIAHRADGTVVYANRGACELLGYGPEELLAIEPWGWIAPEQIAGAPKRIETILYEGRLVFSSSCRRKSGATFPSEVTSRRVDTSLGPIIVADIRDTSERTRAEQRLRFLAFHDGLTGVANRTRLDERLSMGIANAKRHGDLLGLAYIDLDDFKPINDHYGHAVGDEVLIEIGERLKRDVREQDTVARLGGDEFVIVLPRLATTDELPVIARRIVGRIEQPIEASGNMLRVRASVGLALFDSERDDARSLLVKADVAMYAAKRDPEHPWLVYDASMNLDERRPLE